MPAQKATEVASTVYAGVKHKMGAMKAELQALRVGSAQLQARVNRATRVYGSRRGFFLRVVVRLRGVAQQGASPDRRVLERVVRLDECLLDRHGEVSRGCLP